MPTPPSIPLRGLILLRAVQRLDAIAPLDDVLAVRAAQADERTPAARLLARAESLAQAHGLTQALASWRARLPWLALGAAGLVGLLSYGLVNAVVGQDRQINAVAALVAVLGPHLLSLLLWLAGLLAGARESGGGGGEGGGGGGMMAWLMRQLGAYGSGPNRLVLEAALDVLGRRQGMTVWAFGVLNHAVWALALGLTLVGLGFAFSFLAYQLTWETTILAPGFFADFARLSGWLPAQLGFATPDVTGGLIGNDNRGWALWLMGCTLVYGLALRLVLLGLSLLRTRQLLRSLSVDLADPQLRQVLARFAALDAATVLLDREQAGARRQAITVRPVNATQQGTAAIGFELPDAAIWPAGLSAALQTSIAGSADDKRQLLARLHAAAPARLLLLCHGPSSPDRGSERFMRAALQEAGSGALLLTAADPAGSQRWRGWVAQTGLPLHAVFDQAEAAQDWLAQSR